VLVVMVVVMMSLLAVQGIALSLGDKITLKQKG
jgi:hypothetical protein